MRTLVVVIAVAVPVGCSSAVPMQEPPSDSDRMAVVATGEYTCSRTESGEVWCWGRNDRGQLGDGTNIERHEPVRIAALEGVVGLTTRSAYSDFGNSERTCAWTASGVIACWGYDETHRWPDLEFDILEPTRVAEVAFLEGIDNCDLAWRSDGTLVQLGTRDEESALVGVAGAAFVNVPVEPDHHHLVLAWLEDGTVWSPQFDGVEGDDPVRIGALDDVVGVTTGTYHACAWRRDGTALCWGGNSAGKLGDGTTTDRDGPVTVIGLDGIVGMSAGRQHTCAWRADGTAWCWGWNRYGQLGDGTLTERHQPVQVVGLDGVVAMSSLGFHSCAVERDESVWCWGYNAYGQLGDGTTEDRVTPVEVILSNE